MQILPILRAPVALPLAALHHSYRRVAGVTELSDGVAKSDGGGEARGL